MANIPTANNNPGDLRGGGGSFTKYASPEAGFVALAHDLNGKMTGATSTSLTPTSTLSDFANVYAPASDGNNPTQYAQNIAKQMGVSTDTPIGTLQPRLRDFASAVAKNEGYAGATPTMTASQFAAQIKAKYPAYQNIDDATLVQKIVSKYPSYGAIIDPAGTSSAAAAPAAAPTPTGGITGAFAPIQAAWDSVSKSQPTDTPLEAGGKAALNIIPSAFNFVKGALGTLNPLNIISNIAHIPGAFNDAVAANGGNVGTTLGTATKSFLPNLYDQTVPEATRDVIGAGIGFAQHPDQILPTLANMGNGPALPTANTPGIDDNIQKASAAMTNDPFGQTAPLVFGADALAGGIDAATGKIANMKNAAADATTAARTADYVGNIDNATSFGSKIPESALRATGTDLQGAFRGAVENTAAPVTNAGNVFGRKPAVSTSALTEDAAGRVVQGAPGDQAVAAKVLSKVDTKNVKTYEDLSTALGSAIKENLKKVDAAHDANPTPVKLSNLNETSQSSLGGKTVSVKMNYVDTALKHLQELYTKTSDPANLAQIKALMQKAKKTGLTSSEINMLARKYGAEFGSKAFSKGSEHAPLTSVNAQAYENVRTGVKETARSLLTDKTAQALDKQTSDMIRVKGLVDRMAKKVNSVQQRAMRPSIMSRIRGISSTALDVITAGGLKALIKGAMRSEGTPQTIGPAALEKNLQQNLKDVQKFENADDATFAKGLVGLLQKANALPTAPVARISVFGRPQPTAVGP